MNLMKTPAPAGAAVLLLLTLSLSVTGQSVLPSADPAKKPVVFEVLLAAEASLEVDGYKTQATGEKRGFESPPVATGKSYTYQLKATWKGNTVTRKVYVSPDKVATFDFRDQLQNPKPLPKAEPKTEAKVESKPEARTKPELPRVAAPAPADGSTMPPSEAVQVPSVPSVLVQTPPPSASQERPIVAQSSAISRKAQVVVDQVVNAVLGMDGLTIFGLVAMIAVLILYAVEDRSPRYVLALAAAVGLVTAYMFMRWPWPFGVAGVVAELITLRKWWRKVRLAPKGELPILLWPTRFLYVAAVVSGIFLLISHALATVGWSTPVNPAIVEATPLLFVGVAFFAWLAIDRPAKIDCIKQAFIALAFVLWGVDLLLPPGPWATFIGAVVIAIYVFDLAWLMEGNLRKHMRHSGGVASHACTLDECRTAGVCSCDGETHGQERRVPLTMRG
jgi:uncharacterized protein (TIGR03000 family)